jgi:hypothetical protein
VRRLRDGNEIQLDWIGARASGHKFIADGLRLMFAMHAHGLA